LFTFDDQQQQQKEAPAAIRSEVLLTGTTEMGKFIFAISNHKTHHSKFYSAKARRRTGTFLSID